MVTPSNDEDKRRCMLERLRTARNRFDPASTSSQDVVVFKCPYGIHNITAARGGRSGVVYIDLGNFPRHRSSPDSLEIFLRSFPDLPQILPRSSLLTAGNLIPCYFIPRSCPDPSQISPRSSPDPVQMLPRSSLDPLQIFPTSSPGLS